MSRIPSALLPIALLWPAGCAGGAAYYGGEAPPAPASAQTVYREDSGGAYDGDYGDEEAANEEMPPEPVPMDFAAPAADAASGMAGSAGGEGWDAFRGGGGAEAVERARTEEVPRRAAMRQELLAQARLQDRQTAQSQPQTTTPTQQTEQASDETRGPLLIYEAILNLAVYQVEENQRSVAQVAEELGGFLSRQDDTTIVIRVPASKFAEAVSRIEALGDVLHRNVQALDVSEEFRDAQIRLRNAEQVRDRLAALLQQARNVEESLRIERELERLTREIELIKGRLRFLEDRIAYSTVTVNFSPKEEESLEGEVFHLPFDWLYDLGLRRLMNLR